MTIVVGTSGWVYEDWGGIVYPKGSQKDALTWMAQYFDALEINATFYRPPSPQAADGWVKKVADHPNFVFSVKLWQRFTHEKGASITRSDVETFTRGLEPLAAAGKLGCVLVQFSFGFVECPEARRRLAQIAKVFGRWPLALEVRHASWARPDALRFIRDCGYSLVQTDQPRSSRSMPNELVTTDEIGYVRLHGRSPAWFKPKASRDEKYDFLYTTGQLKGFVDLAKRVAGEAKKTFVFTNNHYRGQAAANAVQLRSLLEDRRVAAPALLVAAFPHLASFTRPPEQGRQGTLL